MTADLKRQQAETLIEAMAPELAALVERMEAVGIRPPGKSLPDPRDMSLDAGLERIGALGWLACLVLVLPADRDAEELMGGRVPPLVETLRPINGQEREDVENILAGLSDGMRPIGSRFGPRPVREGQIACGLVEEGEMEAEGWSPLEGL